MRIQTPQRSSSGFFTGLFILGAGIAIGLWLPSFWNAESELQTVAPPPARVQLLLGREQRCRICSEYRKTISGTSEQLLAEPLECFGGQGFAFCI